MAFSAVYFAMIVFTVAVNAENKINIFGSEIEIPQGCVDMKKTSEQRLFYCSEKPSSYPQEDLDVYVEKLRKIVFPEQDEEISRVDDVFTKDDTCGDEEHKNCCTESAVERPYFVNSQNKLKLVIHSKFFQQTIRSVRCAEENTECFSDFGLTSFGFKTQCKTDFGVTKLFVYNSETNVTETVPVSFPVSCSCHFSKDLELRTARLY